VRAALVSALGRPPEIGEVPDPVRGEGEALIEVLAVPLNPIDVPVRALRADPLDPRGEVAGERVRLAMPDPHRRVEAAYVAATRGSMRPLASGGAACVVPSPGAQLSAASSSASLQLDATPQSFWGWSDSHPQNPRASAGYPRGFTPADRAETRL
jgi:NADPH:quinone reductase-like Zn-dependent oxidoreductase